jgi:hypothetical protein
MKVAPLARLILFGFVGILTVAASYLLLDTLGVWSRLPAVLTHGIEVLTGLILLFVLLGHLALATGVFPSAGFEVEGKKSPRY